MKSIPEKFRQPSFWLTNTALIAATLILVACGEKPQPPAPPAPPVPQAAPPQLFQQDRDVLDKAKGVEQTVIKSADETKRAEEKQAK